LISVHDNTDTKEMECTFMSNQKKESGDKRALDIVLSLLLLAAVGGGGYYAVAAGGRIDQTTTYYESDEGETLPVETEEETKTIYESEEHLNSEVFDGPLILVNNQIQFVGDESDLVSLYEVKLEADSHSFSVRDSEVLVRQTVASQLVKLFDAFYETTFDDNIVVLSGYRSKEKQQELYDADLAETGLDYSELVAKAGYSEHQTGWCVDLSLYDGSDYDGTGVYSWIDEHCYEYGFVLRYSDSKTDITSIQAEPWHYRYVGQPHAYYMTVGKLCLEEYLELLKSYTYDGEHLMITDYDGEIYEVYYVPAESGYDSTMLPVPGDKKYTVSGNNTDGFIVTVDTGETGEIPDADNGSTAETSTEADDDAQGADSTAENAQ
jgi:D-alanyl-D-alanine carboxypeptidase